MINEAARRQQTLKFEKRTALSLRMVWLSRRRIGFFDDCLSDSMYVARRYGWVWIGLEANEQVNTTKRRVHIFTVDNTTNIVHRKGERLGAR